MRRFKSKHGIYNYIPKFKIKRLEWEFHKGDKDFNPSVPHGHSIKVKSRDGKLKLELWSGKIYDEKCKKICGYATSKEMLKLFEYPGFLEFVEECREHFKNENPGFNLPPLSSNDGFESKVKIYQRKYGYMNKHRNSFVFQIRYIDFTSNK